MKPYSYTISNPSEIGGVIRAFRSLGAKGCSLLISIFTAYTKKDAFRRWWMHCLYPFRRQRSPG